MANEQTPTVTIRLNVLGPLTVECEPGSAVRLPSSKRACHLLALFAIEPTYDKQQLVNYLWSPGEDINHPNDVERERIRGKLDKELSNARGVFGLGVHSGFLGSSGHLVVHRTTSDAIEVVSDLDKFRELAHESRPPADWETALALVRGEAAESLPTGASIDLSWLERERSRQRRQIRTILSRLHPDATADELDDLCQDVLDRRYESATVVPAETVVYAAPTASPADQSSRQIDAPPYHAEKKTGLLHAITERLPRGLQLSLLLALAASVATGLTVWLLRPVETPFASPFAIPPEEAAVNAENGAVSLHPTIKAPRTPVDITRVPRILACVVSSNTPCDYAETLNVHVGDVVMFNVELSAQQEQFIPYLTLMTVAVGWPHPFSYAETEPIDRLTVSLSIGLPVPVVPGSPAKNFGISMRLQFPNHKFYLLSYIPRTTQLLTTSGRLLHYLPNGIMEHGISLQDVGSPPRCSHCEREYTRHITFRAKIVIE
jgi:hypothetical protein